MTLCTQNVDGFHQLAGSADVIELHGNILRAKCSREAGVIDQWAETDETPPRCLHCGAYLRPDVVWFGELLPRRRLPTPARMKETQWQSSRLEQGD